MTTPQPQATPPEARAPLEESILAEARRVLTTEGYGALSMRKIARAVGCTATSIYLYFEGKDDLVHTLIEEGLEALRGAMEAAMDPDLGPAQNFPHLCRAYLVFGFENPEWYEVMFVLQAPATRNFPREKYRRARERLEIFTETLAAAHGGQQDTLETLRAATLAWAELHGVVSLWNARRFDRRIDRDFILESAVHQTKRWVQGSATITSPANDLL